MPQKSDQTRLSNSNLGEPMSDRESTPTNGQPPFVDLRPGDRVLVGRADDDGPADLGLDLAPYGAAQRGVSRHHAAFSYEDGLVHIEDLNSTNGTRINGFQIASDRTYRLRDGDEVEFGSARVVVRFVKLPR
jgi:pSer/pThr/pTyr-binding forkhead associated (FHA) protein